MLTWTLLSFYVYSVMHVTSCDRTSMLFWLADANSKNAICIHYYNSILGGDYVTRQ